MGSYQWCSLAQLLRFWAWRNFLDVVLIPWSMSTGWGVKGQLNIQPQIVPTLDGNPIPFIRIFGPQLFFLTSALLISFSISKHLFFWHDFTFQNCLTSLLLSLSSSPSSLSGFLNWRILWALCPFFTKQLDLKMMVITIMPMMSQNLFYFLK